MTRALTLTENALAIALGDFVRNPTLEESVDFLESITNDLDCVVESALASRNNDEALAFARQFLNSAIFGRIDGVPVQVGSDALLWTEGLEPDELRDLRSELHEVAAEWKAAGAYKPRRLRPAWRAVAFVQAWVVPGYRRTIARRSQSTIALAVVVAQALLQYYGADETRAAVS